MKNKIYFVDADPLWPVGNAGAVIIAADIKRAAEIASTLGLYKEKKPTPIGTSSLKEQVIFYNTGNY